MKRFLLFLIVFGFMLPTAVPVAAEGDEIPFEEWTHQCGDNLFWELEDNGKTLHISGTGVLNMSADYGQYNRPGPDGGGITDIVIDEGCTEIRTLWFDHHDLESVSLPASLRVIGNSVFWDTIQLKEITIPEGVTKIGYSAFRYSALEKVTLPSTLETIGAYAFAGTKLTEITVPEKVKALPEACFQIETLKSVHLPDGLESIGNYCFADSDDPYSGFHEPDITEMNIPDSVCFIGYNAIPRDTEWYHQFDDQDFVIFGTVLYEAKESQSGIYDIPDGVEMICETAFPDQDEDRPMFVKDVHFPDSIKTIEGMPFEGSEFFENYPDPYIILHNGYLLRYVGKERVTHIPEGVVEIGQHAFDSCETLISVHFPASLRRIQKYAFRMARIQDIHLNDGLESIGEKAFERCGYLKEMYIPESVTEIGNLMIDEASTFTKIIGEPGSEAEAFANRNRNPFQAYEAPFSVGYDMTPVYGEDNWAISNGSDYFGSTYFMKDEIRALLRDELQIVTDEDLDEPFVGSCYGLSLTMLFAKAGLISPAVIQPGAKHLHDLQATEDVLSVINYYHFLMHSDSHLLNDTIAMTPERKLLKMIEIAENVKNGQIPFLLTFSFKSGRHAMLGYGIEIGKWEWNGSDYNGRILIWDPNSPNALHEGSCLYYDTETLNFCIPYYNVYYEGNRATATGNIDSFTNDLSALNYHPYPFAAVVGDLNGSGTADISDAVLLCKTLSEDQQGSSVNWDAADLDGDGILTICDFQLLLDRILTK